MIRQRRNQPLVFCGRQICRSRKSHFGPDFPTVLTLEKYLRNRREKPQASTAEIDILIRTAYNKIIPSSSLLWEISVY